MPDINVTTPPLRRRKDEEIPGRKTAIRWFCYECMGYDSDGCGTMAEVVRQCQAPECPLYPWRNGTLDPNC